MHTGILSNLVITNIRSANDLYTPENTNRERNDRKRWAMILKYEGQTVYTCEGKQVLSDIEHMVLLPKGCSYKWECVKAGHFFTIEFESEATFSCPIELPIKNGEKFLRSFRELEYKRNLQQAMGKAELIRDLYNILLMLTETRAEPYLPKETRQKIEPALRYISQNYNKPMSNDSLAAMTGLSTVYFRKLFTGVMGVSPMVYARQIRIRKAQEMLRSDHGPLSHVAASLGYASLYDFSRDFKKHTGIAPSKY